MVFVTMFLVLMLGKSITCVPQDLSGKMFTFPAKTDTAHVKITTSELDLGALTVCLRFFTDLTREYNLISLATPTELYSLYLRANNVKMDDFRFVVGGYYEIFHGHNVKQNAWQSVCGTWKANGGLTQLWVNGYPGSRKFTATSNQKGAFTVILGQKQDSLGGGFNKSQSFVGMMSDVHMWDYVLTPDQIQAYSYKGTFPNGAILNWASLEFQTTGRVHIEDELNL